MNYRKFSESSEKDMNKEVTLTVNQDFHFNETIDDSIIKDAMPEPVIEKEVTKVIGTVTGCNKLNVRSEPSKDSDILCVINKGDKVELNSEEDASYEDFYAIVTTTNVKVKGYCMKQYISVK